MRLIFILFSILFLSTQAFASPELDRAVSLNDSKNYQNASELLYSLSRSAQYRKEQAEIAFELARALEGMGLRQSAVFQLIKSVRIARGATLEKALNTLARIAFDVGDDIGLNYALSRINIRRFPDSQKPILYFRFGEAFLNVNRFRKAIKAFSMVPKEHYLYPKARYFMGLAFAEYNRPKESYRAFTQSANARAEEGITDDERVAALMGRARALYQMKKWDASINAYRIIPRDSKYFHDMLFESAWAQLRAGKFRSALSNFQSLHSQYYEDYFYPEAALLRAIVYLYICRVDEVNTVLQFYENTYEKDYKKLQRYLDSNKSPVNDIKEYLNLLQELKKDYRKIDKESFKIPYAILRHINRSSKVKTRAEYYVNLVSEIEKIDNYGAWSGTAVASALKSGLSKRKTSSLKRLGLAIREQLESAKNQLIEFGDQKELIKFELITAEKEGARKKLEAKDDFDLKSEKSKSSRFSFTKNGYEYWPFQGEYWLDEIGNYHYLGVSRCE